MKFKTVFCYNLSSGIFIGTDKAQESPRRPGEFLMPKNSTEVAPPEIPEGKLARWSGSEWTLEDIPAPPPEPSEEKDVTPEEGLMIEEEVTE